MIKFIYFDVGGVFVDFHNVFRKVTTDFDIPMDVFSQQWDLYYDKIARGKINAQELWNTVRSNLQISSGKDYDFLTSWMSDYRHVHHIYDFVKELAQLYKIGLITNIYPGMMTILKKRKFVPDILYAAEAISCDIGMKKPEKRIYEYAQKKAGVKSSEILLVDDRDDFIKEAMEFGWQGVQFQTYKPKESIQEIKRILKL